MTFQLDSRLQKDCYLLAESEHSLWLLLNNSYFPWFVIVPKTEQTELYLLAKEQQDLLQRDINLLSEFVHNNFDCDKLNVASIGNIVKQMHIHIIARTESDKCWPGVVWGTSFKRNYKFTEVMEIQQKLKQFCQYKSINGFQFASLQ
ncbi:MAG: diadenosine tetraphosphate (Ap4A) HIT family hydrolase [Psychromonas sp.]|jgi:diadenosine tetraphosphate (Ap4A) HIT family hydrolase|uniref:HIT family protein n=1 Tax=Psychromonas sp. TaxID=1884585 RepID=UPI0039E6C59D